MPFVPEKLVDWVPIDTEILKEVYENEVLGAGATIIYQSFVCAVDMADKRNIDAVIVANKKGLTAYRAKVYIDSTGDADLAFWVGNSMAEPQDTSDLQPSTHCFMLANVNESEFNKLPVLQGGNPKSPIYDIIKDSECGMPDSHMCYDFVGPNTMAFNAGHIWNVDPTDPESVTRGIIEGKKLARKFLAAFKKYMPTAFADAYLASTAETIGSRESRRIIGDYVFTTEDYFARRSFSDEIGRNCYFIDIHKNAAESKTMEGHSDNSFEHYKKGESHGIPYRIMCPKDIDNLLVAGRTVSSDRITQG